MGRKFFKNKFNHVLSIAVCAAMTLSLAACGKQGADSAGAQKDYVYVPEYITLEGDSESVYNNYSNLILKDNCLYYSQYEYDLEAGTEKESICEYSLEDGSVKQIPLQLKENNSLSGYTLDEKGNIYAVLSDYSSERVNEDGFSVPDITVCKYDTEGAVVFEKNITELMTSESGGAYINGILLDEEGRIYICAESMVILLKEDGAEQGVVSVAEGWINGIGKDKEGKVYISYYDYASTTGGMVLASLDFQNKKIGDTYQNFPGANSNQFTAGIEKDILVRDDSKLYEYDIESESYEEILAWLDCDINGSYVQYVGATESGDILAVINDWDTNITELAKLNRTEASEVVQKEEIVIGTLYENQELQAAAVAFNKASDTYHVSIKAYIDNNAWSETSYEDAITNINNDITSEANCPDILDLSALNTEQLAAKGVLEDLTPYLEKSSLFAKEDFLDNILEGFTYDGVLVTIPTTFWIETVAGKTSEVGEEMGWSLEEMMNFAKEHPDAELFEANSQLSMLYYCMLYNQDVFVDWAKGECHFDSEEFKTILEFVNMIPEEIDYSAYEDGFRIEDRQAGKILLENVTIYDFQEIQMYPAMYGEPVTFIGFPTTDGSEGCTLIAENQYGITAKSENKEGAWAFIESFIANSGDSMYGWGFSTLKDVMQAQIDEITKVEYVLDENGEQVLDENGEPITMSGNSSVTWDNWEYEYHTPTQEEIELVKELIAVAKPVNSMSNDELMNIITEEADAYFKGQKSIDDVVGIIQSRAQVYISENS